VVAKRLLNLNVIGQFDPLSQSSVVAHIADYFVYDLPLIAKFCVNCAILVYLLGVILVKLFVQLLVVESIADFYFVAKTRLTKNEGSVILTVSSRLYCCLV